MAAFLTLVQPPETGAITTVSDDGSDTLISDEGDVTIADESGQPLRIFTLAEIKTHLRITNTLEDDYIYDLIDAATAEIDGQDGWLGRALLTQTWRLTLDYFPRWRNPHGNKIILPLPPLQGISSVKYIDENGTQQTMDGAAYTVVTGSTPGYIIPAYNTSWPGTRRDGAAVEIEYVCGYGEAADIPPDIKQYLKMRIGDFYNSRETVIIGTTPTPLPWVDAMLANKRVRGALCHDGWQT